MAYSPGDLRREIHRCIETLLVAGQTVKWKWLVTDVLNRHPLPLIPDLDFNVICRRLAVTDAARDVLRDLKLDADDPAKASGSGTMPLPGFQHLQVAYPVERDNELVIVPIDKMTDAERLGRALQYRAMARGCIAHAEELERYRGDLEHKAG
jgi:hypothetical protein